MSGGVRQIELAPEALHTAAAAFYASQPAVAMFPEPPAGDPPSAAVLAGIADWFAAHDEMCAHREASVTNILESAGLDATALSQADTDSATRIASSIKEV